LRSVFSSFVDVFVFYIYIVDIKWQRRFWKSKRKHILCIMRT